MASESEPQASNENERAAPPYRNLWVPLIIVPAAVIGVMLLVFVFFSAITGAEATPEENLRRMVQGGANERQQAAFNLVRQLRASAEGIEEPWQIGPAFLEEVVRALEKSDPSDLQTRLILAHVLAQSGDPRALPELLRLLALDDEQDPKGELRFDALVALKRLGDASAAGAVIPFLEHQDQGLRMAAASALKTMPGEATSGALRSALKDESIEVRGTAALSLSFLGDTAGADVLADLTDPATYEAARVDNPEKFASALNVRENRIRAIDALARLGRAEDRELLEAIARGEPDLDVREAAQRALALERR
jgi:HEAT repeat protein